MSDRKSRGSLDGEIIKIRRGLAIYKVHASPYWMCRILDSKNKKYIVRSTKETTRIEARKSAEELVQSLFGPGHSQAVPTEYQFGHFADILLQDAENDVYQDRRAKSYVKDLRFILENKVYGLRPVFGKLDVREIATKDYTAFIRKLMERRDDLSASTHNQIRTAFRKVMKVALMEGAIASVPDVPKLNRSAPSSRTFFRFHPLVTREKDDYKKLIRVAKELAGNQIKVRGIPITDELRDIILFTVHSFVRPTYSELYALKHGDVTIRDNPNRLQLTIRKGKTGTRIIDTMEASVPVYTRILDRYPNDHKDDDYLFLPHYKNRETAKRVIMRQFNYLLDTANLKIDPYTGHTHSMYSLRHTCLCMRLVLSEGRVNVYALANNAGTSVQMLQDFYLRTLPPTPQIARNLQLFGKDHQNEI
jgi:calcineurin-like phosphoesterase family protein